MAWFNNIRMAPKLIGSFALVAILAVVVGGAGLAGMTAMQTTIDGITANSTPGLVDLLQVKDSIDFGMRATRGAILAPTRAKISDLMGDVATARAGVQQGFQAFLALPGVSARDAALARQLQPLLARWDTLTARTSQLAALDTPPGRAAATRLTLGAQADTIHALTSDLTTLLVAKQHAVNDGQTVVLATHIAAQNLLLAMAIVAMLAALALGLLIARAITRPLSEVHKAAASVADNCMVGLAAGIGALAQGDLTVATHAVTTPPSFKSRDEIGQTAEVVRTIISRAQAAIHSYEAARAELRHLIGQIAQSSHSVDGGVAQLAQSSSQIGAATGQIARAIEEVARGTGEQSRGASEMMAQMADLGVAVSQVAAGAGAQTGAIGQTEQALDELRAALAHTAQSAAAVTGTAQRAASTAQDGGHAVAQTLQSIDGVRAAVLKSAEQVHALGQRSAEVGQIVQAIDDIAAQTNLLALNAAIEAARAGEHGKGFAVVAAEVRKLAERAATETKEITARIGAIQQQVSEVVSAMQAGSSEVEQSATLGQQARSALESILGVVEETNAQALAISSAVTRMSGSVEAVGAATEQVASVAEQTVEATVRMQAGAERVGTAIESIAAVSEQSAAGAEEVSASTEQQSASAQQMAAGAQELAALAAGLQEVVARFTLEAAPGASGARTQPLKERRAA